MKRFLHRCALVALILLSGAFDSAFAENYATGAQGSWYAYVGAGTGSPLPTAYATFDLCKEGTRSMKIGKYVCKSAGSIVVGLAATDPGLKTQSVTCASPLVGTWTQTATAAFDSSRNTWTYGSWVPPTAPDGACTTPTSATVVWTKLVAEYNSFTLTVAGTVRFGVDALWVQKDLAAGTYDCSWTFFGDPAPGQGKACYLSSTAVVVSPPPVVAGTFMPYIDPAKIPAVNLVGYSTLRIQPVSSDPNLQPVAHGTFEGDFREPCEVAKFAYVDPLLFPGQATAGHLHVFWGNTGITGNSNSDSIANSGNSTCAGGIANRTGYWMPAMIDTLDGATLMPVGVQTYYKSGPHAGRDVKELPPGLRMIAGAPAAKTVADVIPWSMRYTCVTASSISGNTNTIPTDCPAGGQIWAIVVFPSCWDGVNLDSPNHRSHMSMAVSDPTTPTGQGCPATHPVKLPEISTIAEYVVPSTGAAARWRLASDNYDPSTGAGGLSLHSDWWNGWQPAVVKTWTTACLNAEKDCHSYLLGDGTMVY